MARLTRKARRKSLGPFKSQFEKDFALHLYNLGVEFTYESEKVPYVIEHVYNPDFKIGDLIIETKGLFTSDDRRKHLAVKAQNPELDIRFVFQRDNRLSKVSRTKYSDWCLKHGFKYYIGDGVPEQWIKDAQKESTINTRTKRRAVKKPSKKHKTPRKR